MRKVRTTSTCSVCTEMNNEFSIEGEVNCVKGFFVLILSPLELRTCHRCENVFFSVIRKAQCVPLKLSLN